MKEKLRSWPRDIPSFEWFKENKFSQAQFDAFVVWSTERRAQRELRIGMASIGVMNIVFFVLFAGILFGML